MTQPVHTPGRVLYRFLVGRPLDGVYRTDAGYLRPGRKVLTGHGHATRWAMLPGWKRQAWRLGTPAALVGIAAAYDAYAQVTVVTVGGAATFGTVYGVHRLRRWWRLRRFRAVYIRPTLAALTGALGNAPVRLHVSPELGNLVVRLAKPMSPAEKAWREWYGSRVEPVLRWAPDRLMRRWWAVQAFASPLVGPLTTWLRRPQDGDTGPRIHLQTSVPYLTADQQSYVQSVITAKIPAGELVTKWDQVGPYASATWTVRRRPPTFVDGYAELVARWSQLADDEFFVGLGVGGKPITISLHDDSPHIACSAGTGGGKSVVAMLLGVQILARGGRVLIVDRKNSHRWARGLPGVMYCSQPADMHAALIGAASEANARHDQAEVMPEGFDPGPRVLVIFEEMNATVSMLRAYWDSVRVSGQPKRSPAIQAFHEIMHMGRSAKYHLFGVAQMLTANTTGGPEARENFGTRMLARYTANNWKMLVDGVPMPRPSRVQGRWQVVVRGEARECQVALVTPPKARLFVHKYRPDVHVDPAVHVDVPGQPPIKGDRAHVDAPARVLTLQDSIDEGIGPWALAAMQKRLQRARRDGRRTPTAVGKRQRADLYDRADLIAWIESELVPGVE